MLSKKLPSPQCFPIKFIGKTSELASLVKGSREDKGVGWFCVQECRSAVKTLVGIAKDGYLNHQLQYTVSNQGGLQVIHNRYMYNLRYIGKNDCNRFWRCVDYTNNFKCPANISTDENNKVTRRSFKHTHGFHDTRILKKLKTGLIYSMFQEAESKADEKNAKRRVPRSSEVSIALN